MKAMMMTGPGSPDVLRMSEIPVPQLDNPYALLVRVHAAGVNPLDTKIRQLHFYYPDHLPAVLGCDGAGVVEDVGRSVTRFRPGDEVYFFNGGLGRELGTYAEFTVVNEAHAATKPKHLSMVEAAGIPLVLITAWEALVDRIGLKAGETILIHGGAGGVGHVAVQLARVRGARVAATVSTSEKAAFVQSLGAECVIDYRRTQFVDEVVRWTSGRGTDTVFDTVGGRVFAASFAALRLYGRIATLLSTACELPDVNKARMRNLMIGYVQMTAPTFLGNDEARRVQTRILEEAAPLLDRGNIKVSVSATFPLAEAQRAHKVLEEGHTSGKVVLTIV